MKSIYLNPLKLWKEGPMDETIARIRRHVERMEHLQQAYFTVDSIKYLLNKLDDQGAKLRVGEFTLLDEVETIKGAKFWGIIIAFDMDIKSPGCTVMAIDPDFAGTKHVYPIAQIKKRERSVKASLETIEETRHSDPTTPATIKDVLNNLRERL